MTIDAEKLLRYIIDEFKKCKDVKVAVDMNKLNDIADIKYSPNKLLEELKILDFISDYEENVFGELNVYLTSKGEKYLNEQQEFERVSNNTAIFVIDGGQVNIASGNTIIKSYSDSYSTNNKYKNDLPIDVTFDFEYVNSLYEHLESYQIYITKIVRNNPKCIEKIKQNVNLIKQTINFYYNGKIRKAYECIKKS